MIIRTKQQIVLSHTLRDQKRKRRERGMQWGAGNGVFDVLEREREPLLSRFAGDPTVGIRRDKKESGSKRRGLCLGSGFWSFQQTP